MADFVPLVYNPMSGGGRGEAVALEAAGLLARRGVLTRAVPTRGPGGAAALAEGLAREGASRIVVVGGDGTLSEAADGVLRSGRDVALGLMPGGTGNSFLIDFGLTSLEAAAERIAAGKPRRVDAALATWDGGSRHFINVFGVGFMAKVCDFANRRLKWMGSRSYTAAVFPELVRLRSPETRLVLDGVDHSGRYPLVAVCNTIHTGGAMRIAPVALPDDGLLDVVALKRVGRIGLLRLFPRIFDGSHVSDERVLVGRAREVEIAPAAPSPLLGDGEVYGSTPVRIRALPGALGAYI